MTGPKWLLTARRSPFERAGRGGSADESRGTGCAPTPRRCSHPAGVLSSGIVHGVRQGSNTPARAVLTAGIDGRSSPARVAAPLGGLAHHEGGVHDAGARP